MELNKILEENGFTAKESKIYLSALELGNAPASSIARHCGENRVTTYTVLKSLAKKGVAKENAKKGVKYYLVLEPKLLLQIQKEKIKKLQDSLPELLAVTNTLQNKPKVYFYDGLEGVKNLFYEVLMDQDMLPGQEYLTFLGTNNSIDTKLKSFLTDEFIPWRLKQPRKTKSIITKDTSIYHDYTKKSHDFVIIDDPIFEMGNEIILYGKYKVAILLYSSEEMSALVIESKTLFKGLKNIFNLLWKLYKK